MEQLIFVEVETPEELCNPFDSTVQSVASLLPQAVEQGLEQGISKQLKLA